MIENAIVLTVMRFGDELVDVKQFDLPSDSGIRKPELDMAKALVGNLAAAWDPEKYTDEYRENLMKVIQAKVKGKKIDLAPAEEPRQAEVVDLMERLRQSLQGAGGGSRRRAGAKPVKKTAARRKTAARGRSRKRAA